MWIARDKNNKLELFSTKPYRNNFNNTWLASDYDRCPIMDGFLILANINNVKWEDEPVEVEINPVKKKITECYNCKSIVNYNNEDLNNGFIICPDCGTKLTLLD